MIAYRSIIGIDGNAFSALHNATKFFRQKLSCLAAYLPGCYVAHANGGRDFVCGNQAVDAIEIDGRKLVKDQTALEFASLIDDLC